MSGVVFGYSLVIDGGVGEFLVSCVSLFTFFLLSFGGCGNFFISLSLLHSSATSFREALNSVDDETSLIGDIPGPVCN